MSSSIKEIIIKFIFVFLFLFLMGYFIKWLDLNLSKSLGISTGIVLVDFIAYHIKKTKQR